MPPREYREDSIQLDMSNRRDNKLEIAIGREVRFFRKRIGLTVAELAKLAGLSTGMLSKVENGAASPSLATLRALSQALNIPVTTFFRKYEEEKDASFVRSGQGLIIERRGSRSGHLYQLLGHSVGKSISVEPYMITLTEKSEIYPNFQHSGMEFIFMLEGIVVYRHGDRTYTLTPGDSLLFDADSTHGPEELVELPIRFLSVLVYSRLNDS